MTASESATVEIPSHVEIDVTRPNGTAETVVLPGFRNLTAQQFATLVKQTAAAGRGTVTAYRNISKTIEHHMTEADLADRASVQVARMAAAGERNQAR